MWGNYLLNTYQMVLYIDVYLSSIASNLVLYSSYTYTMHASVPNPGIGVRDLITTKTEAFSVLCSGPDNCLL